MLWRPHEPVYPRLIKTTIDGLSIEETKEMRKRGLAAPVLTKLGMPFLLCSISKLVIQCGPYLAHCNCSEKWLLWQFGTHGKRCFS